MNERLNDHWESISKTRDDIAEIYADRVHSYQEMTNGEKDSAEGLRLYNSIDFLETCLENLDSAAESLNQIMTGE